MRADIFEKIVRRMSEGIKNRKKKNRNNGAGLFFDICLNFANLVLKLMIYEELLEIA